MNLLTILDFFNIFSHIFPMAQCLHMPREGIMNKRESPVIVK